MVFLVSMMVDAKLAGEAVASVQTVLDAGRAGTPPSELVAPPSAFVAFLIFSIWMVSAISSLWIMLAARRLVERAIDELFLGRSC